MDSRAVVFGTLASLVLACGATPKRQPANVAEPKVASVATTSEEAEQTEVTAMSDQTCAQTELCELSGHCTGSGDGCVVGGDSDCERSEQCRTDGACSASDEDECVAATDAECKASFVCKRERRCKARDGYCVRS